MPGHGPPRLGYAKELLTELIQRESDADQMTGSHAASRLAPDGCRRDPRSSCYRRMHRRVRGVPMWPLTRSAFLRALVVGILAVMVSLSISACGGDADSYGGEKSGAFQMRSGR